MAIEVANGEQNAKVLKQLRADHGPHAEILVADRDLSADQLCEKYDAPLGEGQHPVYEEGIWMHDVLNKNSRRGYWDWVAAQIEQDYSESEHKALAADAGAPTN